MTEDNGRVLDWDDVITKDGDEFELLPPGDYDIEVLDFERGRYEGGAKLPPCPTVTIKIRAIGPEGEGTVHHRLFMHSRTEGLLAAFFKGIGQKKKGEPLKMNWNAVPDSKGRAKIGIRTYTNKDGEERQSNEIKKFYDPPEKAAGNAGNPRGYTEGDF